MKTKERAAREYAENMVSLECGIKSSLTVKASVEALRIGEFRGFLAGVEWCKKQCLVITEYGFISKSDIKSIGEDEVKK